MTILVIDDYKPGRELLAELLTSRGHTVKICKDGQEAIILCTQEKFDLVLIDEIIPRTNTVALAKMLKEQTNSILAVMFAGGKDIASHDEFVQIGITSFITKTTTNHAQLVADIESLFPKSI